MTPPLFMLAGAYFSCSGCIGRAFAKLWRVSAINLYLLLLWKTTELYRLELFSFMVLLLLALAVILLDYLSLKFCKPNLHKIQCDLKIIWESSPVQTQPASWHHLEQNKSEEQEGMEWNHFWPRRMDRYESVCQLTPLDPRFETSTCLSNTSSVSSPI